MRSYLLYFLLLLIILIAMVDTWGESNKTIMYGVTLISIVSLIIIKSTEKRKEKKIKVSKI
ncbi:hypothetical protein [Lysinibacillus fusiformis]|uniref:hypothetical protein n=1 Tax=Lysinibacillus fusiformis TaxID=28031 RepID=UPI0011A1CFF0|nr:hypothetical protein [Lysinibacillus fusiformis]